MGQKISQKMVARHCKIHLSQQSVPRLSAFKMIPFYIHFSFKALPGGDSFDRKDYKTCIISDGVGKVFAVSKEDAKRQWRKSFPKDWINLVEEKRSHMKVAPDRLEQWVAESPAFAEQWEKKLAKKNIQAGA